MKKREQPIETPEGGAHYTITLGDFSPDKLGPMVFRRPWGLGIIETGARLAKLLKRPPRADRDVLLLPANVLLGQPGVADDAGMLLTAAWLHPTLELEHTGAAAVDELAEMIGGTNACIVLSRLIVEAGSLMDLGEGVFTWEVDAVAAPPTKADEPPSASA